MGLFGFGKKKNKADKAKVEDEDVKAAKAANAAAKADSELAQHTAAAALPEAASDYEGRGDERGPWDVNDENVPDYDEYLDLGAYYLPFLQHIELRIKASRATRAVLGSTTTYYNSSLEVEAYAAPKTMGLWEDWREDFLAANPKAKAVDGVFGTEILLPVEVSGGKTVLTRIVGVDGPRWMLRGIFSGTAASDRIAKKPRSSTNSSPTSWSNVARSRLPHETRSPCISRLRQASARPLSPHPVKRNRAKARSISKTSRTALTVRCPRISRRKSRPRCRAVRCSPKSAEYGRTQTLQQRHRSQSARQRR